MEPPPEFQLTLALTPITRIVVGFLFSLHGTQKLFAVLGPEEPVALFSIRGLAGLIEFFGGGLIMLGLYTPWVAFLASGEMVFAYFTSHYPRGFWPVMNGGELAVLYCFVFLYFATRGSGPWSLDRVIRGREKVANGRLG